MSTFSQSAISPLDPRTRLVREKYFSLRPKPLERWIWSQGLPQAAERVFWVHWEEGQRGGDWCSQLSLRVVAQRCFIDPSTVTRAYQLLAKLSLIRRADPGRDPANPFQQATAITEVRIPRELLTELGRAPNRPTPAARHTHAEPRPEATDSGAAAAATAHALPKLKYRDFQHILARLSESEKAAYDRAWLERAGHMGFAAATQLSATDQAYLQAQLASIAHPAAPPPAPTVGATPAQAATPGGPRRLSPLEGARLRKRLGELLPGSEVPETFRQMLWAVEEGALQRFESAKAVNIALKKLREGVWSRPNRMPPQWGVTRSAAIGAGPLARPGTCGRA